MTALKLTGSVSGAKMPGMKTGRVILLGSVLMPVALGGCINVNAPDAPIVIELNINIRQEVIYRIAEDVEDNIEENADIF